MKPIPLKSIVFYASSEPKYTGSVGIITSGFIFPTAEIKMQEVKFTFGTFWHEFTHLHLVEQYTDKQKQSLEKLKTTYPHLFMEHEMRNFQIGDWVTHSDYSIDGTVKGARSATGHYPVILDNGQEIKAHEDKLTLKNNATPLELAERRLPDIIKVINSFLATNLAQQLSPAQQAQLNKPGNYTTWQPLTPALIKADLERQAMEFINAKENNQTTDTVPASTTQKPDTVESEPEPSQEDSQAPAETSNDNKQVEQERLDTEKIKNEAKATAEHSPQVEQSNLAHPAISTPTMANVSTHTNPNNTTTAPEVQQIETVVMFRLVVTGHTQARHDHSIPNFIQDIQAAVAVALTEPIALNWAYSFEVVK